MYLRKKFGYGIRHGTLRVSRNMNTAQMRIAPLDYYYLFF